MLKTKELHRNGSVLKSGKVRLRAVEPEDIDLLFAVENDSAEWINGDNFAPFSKEQLLQYAIAYDADPLRSGQLRLVIENTTTGEAMGIVDLYDISVRHAHGFVGIYLLPSFRGYGYASESIDLLCDYCKKHLRLRMLAARILNHNDKSLALFRYCGFEKTGMLRDWVMVYNMPSTVYIYQKNLNQEDLPF